MTTTTTTTTSPPTTTTTEKKVDVVLHVFIQELVPYHPIGITHPVPVNGPIFMRLGIAGVKPDFYRRRKTLRGFRNALWRNVIRDPSWDWLFAGQRLLYGLSLTGLQISSLQFRELSLTQETLHLNHPKRNRYFRPLWRDSDFTPNKRFCCLDARLQFRIKPRHCRQPVFHDFLDGLLSRRNFGPHYPRYRFSRRRRQRLARRRARYWRWRLLPDDLIEKLAALRL